MSNVNIIVDTKSQPYNIFCIVQIKHNIFTSNERTDQRNKPILILVLVAVLSNEGSYVLVDLPEPSLLVYTK